jgi:hypothetical protein
VEAARPGGGILGLCRLILEHDSAVRYELLKVGRSLDDLHEGTLGWPDLLAVVRAAEAGSPLAIATGGERARYPLRDYLLAHAVNALRQANWQRIGDKHIPQPTLIELPGMESTDTRRFGSDPLPMSEFNEWWSG